jgi:uncharacterized membrane protein
LLLFTLFTSSDTIQPSLVEGIMRKILILLVLIFAMAFTAGCGVLVFRNHWPFANSGATESPAIIPEQPILFGDACGPNWFG